MLSFGSMDLIMMGGGFLGGILKKAIDNSNAFKMAALKAGTEARSSLRSNQDDFFKWTRRILALSFAAYVLGGPILAMLMGYPVHVASYEENSTLMAIFQGDADLVWKSFREGFVITPLHVYSTEAIVALYFGSK